MKLEYEGDLEKELENAKHIDLPPLPRAIRENDEKEKYDGNMDNMANRIFYKIYCIWIFWVEMMKDEKLAELLKLDKDDDKDSLEYKSKCYTLDILDYIGHFLGQTNIGEECSWLCEQVKNFKE
jgi:hypothetical protein